ncbi:conserved exported hypothetical protein [Burkholderiales bacterium 8X]|nr:conserved exported hypothetical protein [Burkholderiales bacterium 8X]
MRMLLSMLLLACLAPMSAADVVRCAGPDGSASYTDGPCPQGTRRVGSVPVPETATPAPPAQASVPIRPSLRDSGSVPSSLPRPSGSAAPQQAAQPPPRPMTQAPPAGPTIIDSRGGSGPVAATPPANDSRWSDRGSDLTIIDDGYAYPPAGYRGRPLPPADLRPRIRGCDGTGCDDTLGNRYNRNGQLDRYRSIDGRTCQPVGTTTVCR